MDVIRTSNRLSMENFDELMKNESCQERIDVLSERILKRIYRMKCHLQSTHWNQLDTEEKLEQLIEVNDTLFEQIVSK